MIAADLPALQKIYLEARIDTFDWLSPDQFKREDFEKSTEGEWVLVAELDGEIVGFSSVSENNFLHNLFVNNAHHGKGLGKALLAACFAGKLNKPARLKCIVRNTKACAFYEANGWSIEQANVEYAPDPYHLYRIT